MAGGVFKGPWQHLAAGGICGKLCVPFKAWSESSSMLQVVKHEMILIMMIHLETNWPLFFQVNPPKQVPFQSKQGSFGVQVNICLCMKLYIYTYFLGLPKPFIGAMFFHKHQRLILEKDNSDRCLSFENVCFYSWIICGEYYPQVRLLGCPWYLVTRL